MLMTRFDIYASLKKWMTNMCGVYNKEVLMQSLNWRDEITQILLLYRDCNYGNGVRQCWWEEATLGTGVD